jgi:hypothetical protein
MSDDLKDIISIFENLQNEYIALYEKNNIDVIDINKFKDEQKIKLFTFKTKLNQLTIQPSNTRKKIVNEPFGWDSHFTK